MPLLKRLVAHPRLSAAAFFLLLALLIRSPQFGNPVIQADEQFYLLVGDRMWHGALPFVDVWDRKPWGLFALYAAIRLLGGEGIIQYQVVATLFAAATAWMIWRLARRVAPDRGAIFAGVIYLIFLMVHGGDGGQAPVFYNLLTAIAAWTIVRAIERPAFDRTAFGYSCAAMAIMGVALQVKYSVLFEGVYFGLALMLLAWRRGTGIPALLGAAAIWVVLALLPTGLIFAYYAAIGHGQAFFFANFQSILMRSPHAWGDMDRRIAKLFWRTVPLAAAILIGLKVRAPAAGEEAWVRRFLLGWAGAALAGLIAFGTFHEHYTLPLLLPFAIAGAPAYAWLIRLPGRLPAVPALAIAVTLIGCWAGYKIVSETIPRRGNGSEMRAMAAIVNQHPGEGLFIFSGDPILYHMTGAPLLTKFAFPTQLSERVDAESVGQDTLVELQRVMALHPRFVATVDPPPVIEAEPVRWAYMNGVLARDYRVVMKVRTGNRDRLLYERIASR